MLVAILGDTVGVKVAESVFSGLVDFHGVGDVLEGQAVFLINHHSYQVVNL